MKLKILGHGITTLRDYGFDTALIKVNGSIAIGANGNRTGSCISKEDRKPSVQILNCWLHSRSKSPMVGYK